SSSFVSQVVNAATATKPSHCFTVTRSRSFFVWRARMLPLRAGRMTPLATSPGRMPEAVPSGRPRLNTLPRPARVEWGCGDGKRDVPDTRRHGLAGDQGAG